MLKVSALRAGYDNSPVLFGIDLEVRSGQIVALLGRNGMGKSTTLKAIMGVIAPWEGQVHFNDQNLTGQPLHEISRQGIAWIPEERWIFPNLTVKEQILATARSGRDTNEADWSLDEVLALFPNLAQRLSHWGNQLSGGEQQMLAIARALMTNPQLLLLDEATEGLAPLTRRTIWKCLETIRQRGQSLLVIDKNLADLGALAQYAIVLEKGRCAWAGLPGDLLQDQALRHRLLGV